MLVLVIDEEGRGGILEGLVVVMVDALFHEMFAIHGFATTIPIPEEGGEVPDQRVRLIVPQTEFEAGGESEPLSCGPQPRTVFGHEFSESRPRWQLANKR